MQGGATAGDEGIQFVDDYDLAADGFSITLPGLKASEEVEVEVIYEYK